MIHANVDPAFVGGDVKNTIGCNFTFTFDEKIVNPDRFRLAFWAKGPAIILEVTYILFLFCVD